jgi:hypothetical protein
VQRACLKLIKETFPYLSSFLSHPSLHQRREGE